MTARGGARLLLLLPPLAIAFAMLVLAHDPPLSGAPFEYLFDALTGVVIVLAGVVAMARRPSLRTGPALVVAGYWWYVGSLYTLMPGGTPIPLAGLVLRGYYDVILAFVILAFPGDRLETRRDRVAVVALLAAMVARSGWRLVAAQPGTWGIGDEALANPLHLVDGLDRFLDGEFALSALVSLALLLVAGCALVRLAQSRPGARRIMLPVLAGGALWAGGAALYGVAELTHIRLGFDVVPWEGPGWAAQYALRALGPIGILVGMVRLRSGSSAAVALLAAPGGPPRGAELERALREAVGDPSLRLVYPAPGGWVTASGEPATLPAGDDGRAATVLEAPDGRVGGAVIHDATLLDDPDVIRTVAAVVGLAVDNERLQDDLRTQLEEVRASRTRIVEAADAERRRVERDLHDGAQQRLVALAVSLRTIRARLGAHADAGVSDELDAASDEVRAAIAELRELAQGLDPAILREAGLAAAVHSLADRSPVPVTVDVDLDGRLPPRVETAAYFVASEALANVAKHASASAVTLRAGRQDGHLRLEVADDGIGGANLGGSGLRGLVDRIAAVDGTFELATPPGGGTSIVVTIPCAS